MLDISISQLNCGWLHSPPMPPACCHCLMIREGNKVLLVDTGIGCHDIANPVERIGRDAIDAAGFRFIESIAALRQIEKLGLSADSVTDIVLTHCDPDHAGGLADFPTANVHIAAEEKANLDSGNPRYSMAQFAHGPRWSIYGQNDSKTLGFESRKLRTELKVDVYLLPLFGHTLGHCGVVIEQGGTATLHVGDAYYLRAELDNPNHPVDSLATLRADNDELRRKSLELLRDFHRRHDNSVTILGYHDTSELPASIPSIDLVMD